MGEQAATPVAATAVLSPPVEAPVLQRKCDCGNHTIAASVTHARRKKNQAVGTLYSVLRRAAMRGMKCRLLCTMF